MGLFDLNSVKKVDSAIIEKIRRRRLQIMVHSVIYYDLDDSIISDATWSGWAKELVELQEKYPAESKAAVYYDIYKNFDGSTGFDLSVNAPEWVVSTAHQLLIYKKEKENED